MSSEIWGSGRETSEGIKDHDEQLYDRSAAALLNRMGFRTPPSSDVARSQLLSQYRVFCNTIATIICNNYDLLDSCTIANYKKFIDFNKNNSISSVPNDPRVLLSMLEDAKSALINLRQLIKEIKEPTSDIAHKPTKM